MDGAGSRRDDDGDSDSDSDDENYVESENGMCERESMPLPMAEAKIIIEVHDSVHDPIVVVRAKCKQALSKCMLCLGRHNKFISQLTCVFMCVFMCAYIYIYIQRAAELRPRHRAEIQ